MTRRGRDQISPQRKLRIGLSGAIAAALAAPFAQAEPVHTPVTDEMLVGAHKEANNWLMAGRDYSGTRYSPLAKISTKNVKRLVPVWSFSFGVLDAQNTTPLVVDGVMYVTASHGKIFAVEAATGIRITDLPITPEKLLAASKR